MTPLIILLWLGFALSQPSPLSIPPSAYWDGNDGKWSTFHVHIGNPGQTLRLLPGTSASAGSTTWVVIPQGCSEINAGVVGCEEKRGSLFRSNLSISWSTEGLGTGSQGALYELNTYEESKLGLSGNAYYGYDSVTLGIPGSGLPTVEHQVIAGFATNSFWLGSLGLSAVPFNFTNLNDPQPSLLGSLRTQDLIPSHSWSYTAGAYYRDPPVFGSLTLGGYDGTRVAGDNLTYAFGADFSRDLLVTLESITYDTAGSSPLLTESISIFIDSLVTDIWLPLSVCRAFEQQFGLQWDDDAQMYLVDDDTHEALTAQNPVFNFTFSQPDTGRELPITLPYGAFDLEVTQPLANPSARYFPLKRAQNDTQYTLGRVFLQEAFVITDYDQQQFSISQAAFPSTSVAQDIVPIGTPDQASPTAGAGETTDDSAGLTGGAIAGIAVGAVVLIAAAIGLWWIRRRKRRASKGNSTELQAVEIAEKRGHLYHDAPVEVDGEGTAIAELEPAAAMKAELSAKEHAKHCSELDSKANVSELAGPERPVAELEGNMWR